MKYPTLVPCAITTVCNAITMLPKGFDATRVGTAGVVVSCKIPILATRVRFPGGAIFFLLWFFND